MKNRIRELRKERGFTGPQIAKILNITPTYFYELELGKKRLSADMASRIAEIFGVTVDYLLCRSDDPNGQAPTPAAPNEHNPYALSPKEELDIAKDLERIMENLESNNALAFHGEPLDDETKRLLQISLENSMRLAKELAKKKFTPRKYKK
jgi:transcriptional regulator with XRE-family HTH domain